MDISLNTFTLLFVLFYSSVEGRRQSLAQLIASPYSSNKGTPHKSLYDLIPSIPVSVL